ncbi:MAG: phosphopantetheine-binding protein [Thermodesulfobacteriota bacterium]
MKTEDRVKKVLIENALKGIDSDELTLDSELIEYGVGLDSVATLELVVALEQEFKVHLDEDELTADVFDTIKSISKHIEKNL